MKSLFFYFSGKTLRITAIFCLFLFLSGAAFAENIYDLWDIHPEDWETYERKERYEKLSLSYRNVRNKEFYGRFWEGYEQYRKWGTDYYELMPYYESYAFRNFENYSVVNNRRRRWSYDTFGDRIIKMGGDVSYWSERFNPDATWGYYRRYTSYFLGSGTAGVTIASESTRDWSAKLIFSGTIQAYFTPMTLKISMLPGMRFDFWSPNNHLTMLRSDWGGGGIPAWNLSSHTLLTGLHYIRKLGLFNLGTTYINMHAIEGARQGGNTRKGQLYTRHHLPALIAVRFADDSPEDGMGGPVVQNLRLIINGEPRPDIIPEVMKRDFKRETTALGKTLAKDGSFQTTNYMEFGRGLKDAPNADYYRTQKIPYYAD